MWQHLAWRWQERSFLNRTAEALTTKFPNPDRAGCPGTPVLRKLAAGTLSLHEAGPFMNHLASCSNCFQDFRRFKQHTVRHQVFRISYAAATLLLLTFGIWWFHRSQVTNYPQQAVLDLRNLVPVRGIEPATLTPVAEISRSTKRLEIVLPIGAEGHYTVQLSNANGAIAITSEAAAGIRDSSLWLPVEMDLSRLPPGIWRLSLRSDTGREFSWQIRLK